jgi:molybdopterin-binding protein
LGKELPLQLSARNQLKSTVRAVKLGTVMAEVEMEVGGQTLVAAITRVSAERLDLKPGDQVTAVIKATEVIVAK